MKKSVAMREVGRLRAKPLERFGRVQRRAAKLAPRSGQPRGVFKFSSRAALAAWRKSHQVN